MSTAFNLTETQLQNYRMEIYKMEFYKKKKNWWLYEDTVKKEPLRKPSPRTTEPKKLNRTYSIKEELPELEYEEEQVSPHNKAFLDEEPDDAPDPQPPDNVPRSLPVPPHLLSRRRASLEKPWSGDKSVAFWEMPQQDCWGDAKGRRDEVAYDQRNRNCQQDHQWKPATHLELKPAVDPLDRHMQYLTPAQMRQTAEDWLTMHGCPVRQEEGADSYEENEYDESADFLRGAHYAPHSSEIDLSIAQECPCTYNNSLCSLSVRQLSRAIQRHHSALTLLLREQAIREKMANRSPRHPPIPFEDYPTRDTDPLRPLSGTHRLLSAPAPGADSGRGRGRLQQQRNIGMGRPYPL